MPLSNDASDHSPKSKPTKSPAGEYATTKFGAKHYEKRSPFETNMIHYSEINYKDQAKEAEAKFRQTAKDALKGKFDAASTQYNEDGSKKVSVQLKDRISRT